MSENKTIIHDSQDQLLLTQIKNGNKGSFNALYEKYWEILYNNAYKRLKDAEPAKDIVQEIFTFIWVKRESLQIDNVPAYLNTAVRNKVFKLVAQQKLSHPFFEVLQSITDVQPQADEGLLTKEFLKSYETLIKTLSSKKEIIFRLRYQEDLSTRDIAQLLKLSRKTVQNQLLRAIEQLRVSLFYQLILSILFLVH
jgi:RNA polymerase sigma-70 factor (ECF subfamily)